MMMLTKTCERQPAQPRPTRLALTAVTVAVLAVAGTARAADTPADKKLDTVVITGFRASLESALNAKRDDNGIVDVIKAEDIAKFPDSNLAESLQRIPGVVIDRDAGEGRSITVRGLGSDFTRVRINGIEALATTGGTDSSGGANRGRGFDFNVFAAELFNSLTVRKSASADVDEGSLGATVDLQTARPFDLKGFNATVSIKGRYNDLAGKTDPRAAFLISNTFADNKIGVLLSGAFSKRHLFEEGFSAVRWDNGASNSGFCAPVGVVAVSASNPANTCGPAVVNVTGAPVASRLPNTAGNVATYQLANAAGNFHPRLPRYGRLTHDQNRTGLTASFQMRPVEGTLLTADMLYSKLDATRREDFLEAISFSRTIAQGGKAQTSVVSASYDANGGLLNGVYNGVDVRAESRFDKLSTIFTQPVLTWNQTVNDSLKFTLKGGIATSKFNNPVQTTTTLDAVNVNGYGIDFRNNDRLPVISYPFDPMQAGGALTIVPVNAGAATATNITASEIRIRPTGATNKNELLHFDFAWEVSPAITLRGGYDMKRFYNNTFEFRRVNQNETMYALPAGSSVASLTTTLSGFGKGLDLPAGTPTSWVIPNLDAIAAAYDIYCNCLKSGPAGGPGDFTLSSTTNGNARGNNRSTVERDDSAFGMVDFETALGGVKLRGNAGLRVVRTHQTASGYGSTNGGALATASQLYDDWLPSLNIAANLSRDFIVRLAAAKVMARPNISTSTGTGVLSPGASITTSTPRSITTGNPYLQPYRAKTLDASFEWYFQKNAFIGLGLFNKNISTYIQTLRSNVSFKNSGVPLNLLPAGFTGDETFDVTTPVNTPGGRLKGLELNWQQPFSFLPAWGRNFGMLLNYTRVSSQIAYVVSPTSTSTVTDDLLNLSPKAWNATLYYDDGKFSARVSTAYRSAYLTTVPGRNNNDVEGKVGATNVDASISYKLSDQLELTLEGSNLTNAANDQFISRARNSPSVYHVTGREYMAGFRYKF